MTQRERRWLLLLHQIPSRPAYLRVKVWRRLQRIGAVAVKNGAYALPLSEEHNEDLRWIMEEVQSGGGEATLIEAAFVRGMTDQEIEGLFNKARDAAYAELAKEVRALARRLPRRDGRSEAKRRALDLELKELRARYAALEKIDFFASAGRELTCGLLDEVEERLRAPVEPGPPARPARESYRARTWVTRKGIHIDRMASAWLIRRFIDPRARFKWVAPKGYEPEAGELRFDMFEAEFTHVGDACTFEVLLGLAPPDKALRAIAEIVHDIDVKDDKYGRPETAGVASMVAGIALASADDDERLARASALFDQLHSVFSQRRT